MKMPGVSLTPVANPTSQPRRLSWRTTRRSVTTRAIRIRLTWPNPRFSVIGSVRSASAQTAAAACSSRTLHHIATRLRNVIAPSAAGSDRRWSGTKSTVENGV